MPFADARRAFRSRMKRPWLPEAERYRHPLLSWLVQCGFSLAVRVMYRVDCVSTTKAPDTAGALVVSNHQRDSDVPILASALCPRRGLRILGPLPHFAMREDLYQRGGLASVLWRWPWPLRRLLASIPLGWMFDSAHCHPIRRVAEFSLGEALQALLQAGWGRADPATVLNARGLRELEDALDASTPARLDCLGTRVLVRLYGTRWGLRRLHRTTRQALMPSMRPVIQSQLQRLATALDAGQAVYFAPEGRASRDGRMGRIREGTWRLCRLSQRSAPLLPCGLAYDVLAPGRLRAVVSMGEPRWLDAVDSRAFACSVRQAIAPLCAVTPSHLLAHFLLHGPNAFDAATLVAWLRRAVAVAIAQGQLLDPLLARDPDPLVQRRLRWLQRQHLVRREGDQWHSCVAAHAAAGWCQPSGRVLYLAQVLEDLAPRLARELTP